MPPANLKNQAQALAKVFSDKYGFTTETLVLDATTRNPDLTIHLKICKFLVEYDGPRRTSLIIIYYGGYAFTRGKDDNGRIYISA